MSQDHVDIVIEEVITRHSINDCKHIRMAPHSPEPYHKSQNDIRELIMNESVIPKTNMTNVLIHL